MKIDSIQQQTLEILGGDKARRAEQVDRQVATANKEAAAGDRVDAAGLDFSKMEQAHTLDPERVAALIADPFGDE